MKLSIITTYEQSYEVVANIQNQGDEPINKKNKEIQSNIPKKTIYIDRLPDTIFLDHERIVSVPGEKRGETYCSRTARLNLEMLTNLHVAYGMHGIADAIDQADAIELLNR